MTLEFLQTVAVYLNNCIVCLILKIIDRNTQIVQELTRDNGISFILKIKLSENIRLFINKITSYGKVYDT